KDIRGGICASISIRCRETPRKGDDALPVMRFDSGENSGRVEAFMIGMFKIRDLPGLYRTGRSP
ncbi:MAG TPA: hypothetical protein PKK43_13635, partial [Spirochaetota bacterium]|nr:hypothetical protein [Spirochaetota bacterium]